ncbi:MAG TPA: GTPase HflX [Polyangiaceae bacterium]|nr:GTPase HflX [Polyangiaceae bacterium]
MPDLSGNTTGLSPLAQQLLERIYRRRVPPDRIATPELVRSLVEASRISKRQVGVLVHRSGEVDSVIVGTPTGLMLPDIGRLRAAHGRFRALRLIHTHLFSEGLTQDDLVDLTRLRLDLVCAIQLTPEGEPRSLVWAYNVPSEGERKPYEIVGPVPYGHPQPHFGELIASLEEEFARRRRSREVHTSRAILIHVGTKKRAGANARAQASMEELRHLTHSAGIAAVDSLIQLRDQIDPKFVLGRGKLESVVTRAIDMDADLLIFDCELSPTQANSIAQRTDLRVIDRTQLILDIFAQRAETRDGKLQVELAQLKYNLPRLNQKDDALSRLTGGIGGRGPGETKLEIGRRRAKERVNQLEKQLKSLVEQREQRRRKRQNSQLPVIAIVGYTNAGKSTLLNALTGAGVLAEDKLFATLDTRARRLRLADGRTAIISDTVGLIRDMPKDLFSAFRATFEEAADADLLLEIADASSEELDAHLEATSKLLSSLNLADIPRLLVKNKIDRLNSEQRDNHRIDPGVLFVSARDKTGLHELLTRISELLPAAPAFANADAL